MKRIAHSKWPQLDDALFQWVVKARTARVDVFDDTIRTKAREFAEHFGISDEEFSASSRFCDKFKKRHQLSLRTKAGEGEHTARSDDIHDWQDQVLPGLLEGYAPKDVFNADESALFYRLLPHKTLAFRGEKCRGGKKKKERVSFSVETIS
eukprot:scpid100906/ scgid13976/ Tigger transposable element-derived protein 4